MRRLPLPLPWHVEPVNCYVIEDDPLTLVDVGTRSPEGLAALEHGMRALGHDLGDVGRIIVTHQHIDHWGLAATVVARSGAELCAHAGIAAQLADFAPSRRTEGALAVALLRRHGTAPDVVEAVAEHYEHDVRYAESVAVTRPLRDGDALGFAGRRLRVRFRPGHSPSDTVFHDEEARVLFGGDHLMARVASNPMLMPPLDDAGDHGRLFIRYLASLRATRELDLDLVLPGHGDVVADHRAVIDDRLRRYAATGERIRGLLSHGPRTAAELALDLRGAVRGDAAFFPLCEVLGHLDRLAEAGAVAENARADGVRHFALAA